MSLLVIFVLKTVTAGFDTRNISNARKYVQKFLTYRTNLFKTKPTNTALMNTPKLDRISKEIILNKKHVFLETILSQSYDYRTNLIRS